MFLTRTAQLLYDASLALAYPQACTICGRSVEQRRFGVACEACWSVTRVFSGAEVVCWKCGMPSVAAFSVGSPEDVSCRRCDQWSFTAARAAGPYEDAL